MSALNVTHQEILGIPKYAAALCRSVTCHRFYL